MVSPLVEFIGREPGLAERLLSAHDDDGTGHCRMCTSGAQTGRHRFPCQIHGYATAARDAAGRRTSAS